MFIDRLFSSQYQGPSFITTAAMGYHLERMFEEAEKSIIIISPYIKMSLRIYDILQKKRESNVDITIVYREEFEHKDIANHIFKRKNLHAKCFITEKSALIGSMNLYDYSQTNNDEMAIYVLRNENIKLYDEIEKEALRLCNSFSDDAPVHNNRLCIGKKYSREELTKYFAFIDEHSGGIKQTTRGNIVLFSFSKSKYTNEERDGVIYYMGQNTGPGAQALRYGNKALYDVFAGKSGRIFLFKDSMFCGEVVICREPFQRDGKWIFPLKIRK